LGKKRGHGVANGSMWGGRREGRAITGKTGAHESPQRTKGAKSGRG